MHGIIQQLDPIGLFPSSRALAKRERNRKKKESGKKKFTNDELQALERESIGQLIQLTANGARFQQINQYNEVKFTSAHPSPFLPKK